MTITEDRVFELGLDFPVIVADTTSVNAVENREQWLELRRRGLGGSDASAAAGLNPWKSPYSLWAEKTDVFGAEVDSEAIRWGRRLEEPIADEFEERTGKTVVEMPVLLAHPEHPWMLANVDRFIVDHATDPGKIVGILEVKTTGLHMADEWAAEEAPHHHLLQVHHYLAVTGLPEAWLCVLIGGQEMRIVHVPRDEATVETLIKVEREFWTLVENGTPPELDGSDSTRETLKGRYAEPDPDSIVDLPATVLDTLSAKDAAKARIARIEEEIGGYDAELMALMGDHEIGMVDGEKALTWKRQTRKGFTVDETSFRVLRAAKRKS